MSLVSGARDMGFDDNNNNKNNKDGDDENSSSRTRADDDALSRQMSESSLCATEEEEDDDSKLQLGPQYTIKEHLEKDKVSPFCFFFFFLPPYLFELHCQIFEEFVVVESGSCRMMRV